MLYLVRKNQMVRLGLRLNYLHPVTVDHSNNSTELVVVLMFACTKECKKRTMKRVMCDGCIPWNYKAMNNLNCPLFVIVWGFFLQAKAFYFLLREKKFLLSHWSESRLSLSPLCWQVNICLVEDERTVAFSRERTEPFLALLPVSPVFPQIHYHTHSLHGWVGSLWLYCTEKSSGVLLLFKIQVHLVFRAFKHIVPAAFGHKQWQKKKPSAPCLQQSVTRQRKLPATCPWQHL